MFYLTNYYTDEIIDVFDNVYVAIEKCKQIDDTQVVDENNNYYYANVELPF